MGGRREPGTQPYWITGLRPSATPVIISLLFVGVILKYLLVQNNSSLVLADTLGLDH